MILVGDYMKVLVTGASSGIGKSMVNDFLERGYLVYAVSRDRKRLESVYKDIDNVILVTRDLSKVEDVYALYDELKDRDIDILVNNAGFGDCGNFYETDITKDLEMIDLNIKCTHLLTKLFLSDFVKRDRGYILNVASIAGFMPGPYMATYYATKNYVVSLGYAIKEELRKAKSHVSISILCPGPVNTNFNNIANVKFSIGQVTSEMVSKYAIKKMFRHKLIIIPSIKIKLLYFFTSLIPWRILIMFSSRVQKRRVK